MAIGSGLGSSVGFIPEVTYGTGLTPNRFIEATNVGMKKVKNVAQGKGLYAGMLGYRGTRRFVTTKAGGGDIAFEFPVKQAGSLVQALMGTTVTPVIQGAGPAYLQTHTLADPIGKFLTIQAGVPTTAGVVNPYTFLGCKVLAGEFACGVDDLLTCTATIDARDVTEATGLTAPSYVACNLFHFGQMNVKLGTFGAEAAVQGVRKVTVKINRGSADDRFYANNAGLKSEPIITDPDDAITGTIETDYVLKTDFADRFAADTSTSLVWEFIGPILNASFPETFRITVPGIFLETDTPVVDGPGVVNPSHNFTWRYDGTNLPKIEIISTDITL